MSTLKVSELEDSAGLRHNYLNMINAYNTVTTNTTDYSLNVSSLGDQGVGLSSTNFTNPMSSNSYCSFASSGTGTATNNKSMSIYNKRTNRIRLCHANESGTVNDSFYMITGAIGLYA